MRGIAVTAKINLLKNPEIGMTVLIFTYPKINLLKE
jgi:hypothetical protein